MFLKENPDRKNRLHRNSKSELFLKKIKVSEIYYHLIDIDMILIPSKFSIILIIHFLIIKHFIKINNCTDKNYWGAPFTVHTEGKQIIFYVIKILSGN